MLDKMTRQREDQKHIFNFVWPNINIVIQTSWLHISMKQPITNF